MERLIAAVELGGTKVLAAVARHPLKPLRQIRIPTGEWELTLSAVADFFDEAGEAFGPPEALGIASFGPIDIRRGSPGWGRMGRTTKPGWQGADVGGFLGGRLGCPVNLDTDVNGAALAEARWGAGRGLDSIAYLTVGTGIGGGIINDGKAIHGAAHPEIGHVRIQKAPGDHYQSRCPYHDDCAEGLASGPAIMDRFGKTLGELEPDHPFRAVLADYLGQVCGTLVLVVSPQLIVIGGGVMTGGALHAAVEEAMLRRLNLYVETAPADGSAFIVPPALGDQAGLAGGFALAQDLLESGG